MKNAFGRPANGSLAGFSLTHSRDWVDQAACKGADLDLFYNEGLGANTAKKTALRICAGCPVRMDCLNYALHTDDGWAILGGTTPRQRRDWRKRYAA